MKHHTMNHGASAATHRAHANVHAVVAHPAVGTTGRRRAWRHVVPRLSHFAAEYLLLFPIGALIALVWANTLPDSYYGFTVPGSFIVNDILMVFFFGLIMKEVVEATAPGGVLHPWRRAALPLVAALGAASASAGVYVGFTYALGEPMLAWGWPIPAAVDIALAYFLARIIFGREHPAISFLLLLALAANAFGIVMIAAVYSSGGVRALAGVLLMVAALWVAAALRTHRVKNFWPYVLAGGGLSWIALFLIGVAPAFALVPILPFVPHATRDPGFFVDASPRAHDPLNRFELWARYPAEAALFLFGLVNAGVLLGAYETGVLAMPLATVIAKPIGILAATGLALGVGLHLPHRVSWRELVVLGLLTSPGFTFALFLATAAMPAGQLVNEIKLGVLMGLAAALLALFAAWALYVGRFARTQVH